MGQVLDTIIGRDRECAQLERAIGSGSDGLRLVLLTGPAGLGKSTLLTETLRRGVDKGFRVARANGRSAALTTPFAAWIEALPEFAALIEKHGGIQGQIDIDTLGIDLVELLTNTVEKQPLILAFDDAQALDESSLALLPYAVGVSTQLNMTIFFVEQSDAVDIPDSYRAFVQALLARRIVQRIELGPMEDESVRELMGVVLDEPNPETLPVELVLRAQGNPWFAQELAQAWRLGQNEIPTGIAAVATSRLYRLPEESQDIVNAIALCPEGAYIGWLEALSGEKPRQFVRTMEGLRTSGLVREDGELLSIAHPLMQQALLDELSAAMRRALHLELVEVIDQVPMAEVSAARARGFHLSQAGKPDEAVTSFVSAAEASEVLGQLHEAFVDYVRALDSEPRVENRVHLLKKCGHSAMQIGNERASEFWTELGRIAAASGKNELYAFALFHQYWASEDGAAFDRLERAAALGANDFGWSARAAGMLKTLEGDYAAAVEHDRRALELARSSEDTLLEMLALEKSGLSLFHLGRLDEAMENVREAISLGVRHRYHDWVIHAWYGLCETLIEKLDTAKAVSECEAIVKYVDDLGLVSHQSFVRSLLARCILRSGNVELARQTYDFGTTEFRPPSDLALQAQSKYFSAQILVDTGEVSAAREAVESALTLTRAFGFASFEFEMTFEQARLLVLAGEVAKAVELAAQLRISELGAMATLSLWLAQTGVRFSDRHAIDAAVNAMTKSDTASPLTELTLAEIDATVSRFERDGDLAPLVAISTQWEAADRPLEAARTLTTIGMLHVRAGQQKEAIAIFNDARARFVKLGAHGDSDFVAGELRKLGTRSRAKSRSTNVAGLTKRELQIARLVAEGLRNAEVAGQLFLAEKTVAAHLSNIYGKLEVNSRVQLTAWLQENDSEVGVA